MADGIIDFLEFAAAAVLATPVALLGLMKFTAGDILGAIAFFGVAVGMVLIDRIVLAPREIVTGAISGAVRLAIGSGKE